MFLRGEVKLEIDVYEKLADELMFEFGFTASVAQNIVSFLEDQGVIDYDTLKEIFLYDDEEEFDEYSDDE